MRLAPSSSFSLSEFMAGIPLAEEEKSEQSNYLEYCFGNGKTFGEYYVSLIADYFGLSWDHRVRRLHRLTIYLRAYTVVDDDVRDVPGLQHVRSWSRLRQYFLDMAWMEARSLSSSDISATRILTSEIDKYHLTSDFFSKLHSQDKPEPFDKSFTDKYADRMALIRVPLLLLEFHTRSEKLLTNGLRGIESFMRALQILDDLVDWEEDLKEGRITYPILSYLATLSITEAEDILQSIRKRESASSDKTIRALSQELPYHPIVYDQLELALQSLAAAVLALTKGLGSGLLKCSMDVQQRVNQILSEHRIKRVRSTTQGDLIHQLKLIGAAPLRLTREKGH